MFVGPATEYARTNTAHTTTGTSARLSADCLPRHEPLTEVRRQLAHIETRSAGALLNPSGFIDRVAFAANAAVGCVDADVPPARPLSSIARLSQAESQQAIAQDGTRRGRGGGGYSEGAVEVFLAGIGVDIREQQRQMSHVAAMRAQTTTRAGSVGASGLARLTGGTGAGGAGSDGSAPSGNLLQPSLRDMEAVARDQRQDSLGAAIYEISKTVACREMMSLRTGLGGGASTSSVMRAPSTDAIFLGSGSGLLHGANPSSNLGTPRAAPLSGALKSISGGGYQQSAPTPLSIATSGPESARMQANVQEGLERANRFASVVASFPPAEWLGRFAAAAAKSVEDVSIGAVSASAGPSSGSSIERALDLAETWSNVRKILYHVSVGSSSGRSGCGGSSNALAAVAGARSSLEQSFFSALLNQIGVPNSNNGGRNVDPTQVPDIITRYCGSGRTARAPVEMSVWTKVFFALRSGQWRAATAICAASRDSVVSSHVAAAIRDDPRGAGPAPFSSSSSSSYNGDGNGSAADAATTTTISVAQHASIEELRKLYENEATHSDPYRACVLFYLMRGRLGARVSAVLANTAGATVSKEERTVAVAELSDIIKRVSQSVEDVLWLRLSLVECLNLSTAPASPAAVSGDDQNPTSAGPVSVGGAASAPTAAAATSSEGADKKVKPHSGPAMLPFHALRDVHSSILAENPATLASNVFEGNKERLANFYFHALLPATACRALLSPSAGGGTSSIDAVHLAGVFQQRGILASSASSSSSSSSNSSSAQQQQQSTATTNMTEAPLNLESALRSFICSYVTVRSSGPARCDAPLLHIAYGYFRALQLEQAFVNLCANDEAFAARIFAPLVPTGATVNGSGNHLQLLAEAATGDHALSASASNIQLLQLLDRVGMQAMLNAKTTLCAQVSLIQYANGAQLARRPQHRSDSTLDALCVDAVTRAYASLTPALQASVLRAVSARCALVRPNTEFVVDGGVVAAGATSRDAVPADLVQAARTVSGVVEAVGPLSVHQITGGQLSNLMVRFQATLHCVDVLAAWDDKDDATVARIFFGLNYVPTTPAQLDACCQQLNTAGEALVLLMSRVYLLVQYSLQRLRRALLSQHHRQQLGGGDDISLSRVDAQIELLEQWFASWSPRCKAAIAGTIRA